MTPRPDASTQDLEQGFALNGWEVLPHCNALRNCETGHEVRVASKAMQVLVCLANHPNHFVSKEQLLDTVWTDRVVTEDVLTGAVRSLRRALTDDARSPAYIETRKGAGYRLIAPLNGINEPTATTRPRRKRWATLAGAAAVLLTIAAALAYQYSPRATIGHDAATATVAVLPFDTLSGDERDIYLASAMTDGLILNLAERDRFRVISRTSVLPYASQTKSLQTIARELNADYVIEGSVLTENARLRVSAQLVDGHNDTHLWAAKYDRELVDIMALQTDVSNQIAQQIVGVVATPLPAQPPQLDDEGLNRLLKARFLLAQEQTDKTIEALALFTTLSEAYPTVADGPLGMAQAQLHLVKNYQLPVSVLEQAEGSVRRALQLNPLQAEAYRCLGQIVQIKDWDFAAAESHYLRAIELNPSDTVARRRYAWLLVALQRYDDSLAQIAQMRLLDPHYYASADGALLMLFSGQPLQAVAELERLLAETPANSRTLRILSTAYWALGRYDESASKLVESRIVAGNSANELHAAYAADGRAGVYRYLLDAQVFHAPVSNAALHAQLGDVETALTWLERAVAERDPDVIYLQDRPELDALHGNPRFEALVARITAAN